MTLSRVAWIGDWNHVQSASATGVLSMPARGAWGLAVGANHMRRRGNRLLDTFPRAEDYETYRAFMAAWCRTHDVEIRASRPMSNHIHLIAVPDTEEGPALAIGAAPLSDPRATCRDLGAWMTIR